jgi:hypothetical protein
MAEVAMIASGGLKSFGILQEGYHNAAASDYNSNLAGQNAVQARAQSLEEERRQRVISRKQLGDMRANYAASGVTLEGSPLDVLEESAASAEMDALTIRRGGEIREMAYLNEAKFERYKARYQRSSAQLGAASQLIATGAEYGAKKR